MSKVLKSNSRPNMRQHEIGTVIRSWMVKHENVSQTRKSNRTSTEVNSMKFLITKVDFDNLENSIGNAIINEVVGYADSEDKANEYIQKVQSKKYMGWDKREYPQFIISIIENVNA